MTMASNYYEAMVDAIGEALGIDTGTIHEDRFKAAVEAAQRVTDKAGAASTDDPGLDNADAILVAKNLIHCAECWDPRARLVGNLRAGDIARAITEILTELKYERNEALEHARYQPPTIEAVHATLVEDHHCEPSAALALIGTYASELDYAATAGEAALRIMAKGVPDGTEECSICKGQRPCHHDNAPRVECPWLGSRGRRCPGCVAGTGCTANGGDDD